MAAVYDRKGILLIERLIEMHSENYGRRLRVLDLGCRYGEVVMSLREKGFDAYGCDIHSFWDSKHDTLFREIDMDNYEIPFPDNFFDVVVSNSVLEHVSNKLECFLEVHRVLRDGGKAIHTFPVKTYLPLEPHTCIPFASWLHPNVPIWYISFWSSLGFHSKHLARASKSESVLAVSDYLRNDLFYWSNRRMEKLAKSIYSSSKWLQRDYMLVASGGMARFFRRIGAPSLGGYFSSAFRIAVLLVEK